MFFYIVLTPISTTSSLWSTGNTRKSQQIDIYIYQSDKGQYSLLGYKPPLGSKVHHILENSTCDPLKYKIDCAVIIVLYTFNPLYYGKP